MAIDQTGNPLVMTAATDVWVPPETNQRIYVNRIVLNSAGTGGDYEVQVSDGGLSLTGTVALGADETQVIEIEEEFSGLYCKQFGSDGTIQIYHGRRGK
jgi:hypothetical protein